MLRRSFRLPLLAVLVLQVALADSIPPSELWREVRRSRANTKDLDANFVDSFGRSALRVNGRQEGRLPRRMIFVPLGNSQTYAPYGSRVRRPSKSFFDRVLEVLFITKKSRKKGE